MIGTLGVLLFALATPGQLPATGSPAASHRVAAQASAPSSPSFQQISQTALQAWKDGRDDDAIRLFESGLKLKPDWDEGLWYLGVAFYHKKRFGEARDLLRHFVAQNPRNGPAWALLGICEYKVREYDRALDHLQRADSLGLEGRKELADAVSYHGILLLTRSGQFGAARKAISQYLERGADSAADAQTLEVATGLNVLGYQLLPEEVPIERREFVRRMGAAILLHRVKYRRQESKDMLRELVRQHPEEQGTHMEYGALLLEDESPEGVEEMKKVMAISPSHVEARLQLAQYYISRSQLEQARSFVDEALKLAPSHPIAHVLKGQVLNASGDTSAALKEFDEARQAAPADNGVLLAVMRAYIAAGRREDAARVKAEMEKLRATKINR